MAARPAARRRIDTLLVERGLFDSRARAQAAIAAGLVRTNGRTISKPSETIGPDAALEAEPAHPWVSRGGVKLAHALDAFGVDPAGKVCLDVGSSTGGFTQVLLARGASRVFAIDAGRDQLHLSLRGDPRVVLHEGLDIRKATAAEIPERAALAVIDVSFISLRLVLPAVTRLLAPDDEIVALVKPQFEVGRAALGKGGIVKDEAARRDAISGVVRTLSDLGFTLSEPIESPIAGGDGNREYFVHGWRTS
jgi:23S rRNA (cytidine1920-2'-O)/16S rRNA (cytidine1409-2'-O)-methyltransferase